MIRKVALSALLSLAAAGAWASAMPVGEDLAAAGWRTISFSGIPEARFTGSSDGVIEVASKDGASILYRSVDMPASHLLWDWQSAGAAPRSDVRQSEGDDRVLAVHVRFADKGDTSFLGSAAIAMSPFSRGRFITYVFGGLQKDETGFPHPHLPERAWMIVKRPADAPKMVWLAENVDVDADYRRAFGGKAPMVTHVGVSGDCDETGADCRGLLRGLRFMGD